MTALSTAEAALRRAPDDPGVPVTVYGAEAAALVAELDRRARVLADVEELARDALAERDSGYRGAGIVQGYELHELDGAAALAEATLGVLRSEAQPVVDDLHEVVMHDVVWQRLRAWFDSVGLETYPIPVRGPIPAHGVRAKDPQPRAGGPDA